jgi:hypothetical protein
VIRGGIHISEQERVVGCGGGEWHGERVVVVSGQPAGNHSRVPSRDESAPRAHRGGEGEGEEVGEKHRPTLEGVKVLKFGLLDADDVGMGDGKCVADSVALFMVTKAMNVPGHDRVSKLDFIHSELGGDLRLQ